MLVSIPRYFLKLNMYSLRALFNRADTGALAAGDLETQAAGSVTDGALTVVDTSTGTVEVLGNALKITGTPTIYQTGAVITTALPNTIGSMVKFKLTPGTGSYINITLSPSTSFNTSGNIMDINFWTDGKIYLDGWHILGSYTNATYEMAFVRGGFDVNGVPYKAGDVKADFGYGTGVYFKGGTYTTWTLLWSRSTGNIATYLQLVHRNTVPVTYDDLVIPDADLSSVLQPTVLDTFTDANGTALTAHTSDVGASAWAFYDGTADIQGNHANVVSLTSGQFAAAKDSGLSDCIAEAITVLAANNQGVIVRATDASNYILIYNTINNFYIYTQVAGTFTLRASISQTKAANDKISVVCSGNDITAYMNGGYRITYNTTFNNTATKHGLYMAKVGDQMDNFSVHPRTSTTQYDDTFSLY